MPDVPTGIASPGDPAGFVVAPVCAEAPLTSTRREGTVDVAGFLYAPFIERGRIRARLEQHERHVVLRSRSALQLVGEHEFERLLVQHGHHDALSSSASLIL